MYLVYQNEKGFTIFGIVLNPALNARNGTISL